MSMRYSSGVIAASSHSIILIETPQVHILTNMGSTEINMDPSVHLKRQLLSDNSDLKNVNNKMASKFKTDKKKRIFLNRKIETEQSSILKQRKKITKFP
jgi:hypothetical protein